VSGTLVFSSESGTVVAEASTRRDARGGPDRDDEAAAAGTRGARRSAFDLPTLDGDKRPDGGELVN